VPGLYEILAGRVAITRTHDLDLEGLLGRSTVHLGGNELPRLLGGQCVLITGAGGSIGGELARQVCRHGPAELVLVERFEGALFAIEQELSELWPHLRVHPVLADVRERSRMAAILAAHRPAVVLHAAAHKHVPLSERNVPEAVANNVLGTSLLGELAAAAGVGTFVLISSDKAVRPTSVMGASKRLAELVIADLARRCRGTRFLAVRFGNVLGSSGSVVPTFRRQIERGGPVTVTHPEMRRYFMTAEEAGELVLEAAALGGSGELLILDMGIPVPIVKLAEQMIRFAGFEPYIEIPIVFTGTRPGEKLSEELDLAVEPPRPTRHPKILAGQLDGPGSAALPAALDRLERLQQQGDEDAIRRLLNELIPEAQLNGETPGHAANGNGSCDQELDASPPPAATAGSPGRAARSWALHEPGPA
jgi:FlaA1/EpsC-like NDP-sugar epimerase